MAGATTQKSGALGALDKYFSISARGSSFGQEIRGGLTTFLTMCCAPGLMEALIARKDGSYVGIEEVFA